MMLTWYSCFCTVFSHAESSIASYSHQHVTLWIVLVPFYQTRLQLSQPDHPRYLEFSLIFMWESSMPWWTGSRPWITASSLCLFPELASSDSPSSECRPYQTSTLRSRTLCFPVAPSASLRTVKNKLLLITKHTWSIPFQNSALHLTWSLPGLASASAVPGSGPNSYGRKLQTQLYYYRMNAWPW